MRDEHTGLITPQPRFDWFAAGLGLATRKWDGIPHLLNVEDNSLIVYRGTTLELGTPFPMRFIQTSDTGHFPITGWAGVGSDDEYLMAALEQLVGYGRALDPGAYELCGPGIKGNHEGLEYPTLLHHNLITYLRCPRQLDEVIAFMLFLDPPAEGLVWRNGDQSCQLTRRDVGLPWPVPDDGGIGTRTHTSS